MLARREASRRQLGMLVHAGQHEHDVDILTRDELRRRCRCRDRWMHRRDRLGLLGDDIECGGQSRLTVHFQLANQLAVRSDKDATKSEYADSKHVRVLGW